MSTPDTRAPQMFPALNAAQIATARRFASGPERMLVADEIDAFLKPAMLTRTAEQWFALLGDKKHPAVVVPSMA
uniref:hypothetical protein n=1 Tax=Pseudomonas proteolytica TaxID=219574 RepID=UPI0030D72525